VQTSPSPATTGRETLFLGMEHGVPVVVEDADPALFPDGRPATDEYQAYLDYWTAACPVCGRERGEADFCPTKEPS
jgi:hypothetical protein